MPSYPLCPTCSNFHKQPCRFALTTTSGGDNGFGRRTPHKSPQYGTVGTQNIAGNVIYNYNGGNHGQASLPSTPTFFPTAGLGFSPSMPSFSPVMPPFVTSTSSFFPTTSPATSLEIMSGTTSTPLPVSRQVEGEASSSDRGGAKSARGPNWERNSLTVSACSSCPQVFSLRLICFSASPTQENGS